MPFNRRRNNEGQIPPPENRRTSRFLVSDTSFGIGALISSITITIVLVILAIIKATYILSETDIQSICQITAGLSGLTLAIPLFLKDFEITSNFWRQFYLIAITFLLATFIGLFSFLKISATETKEITVYLWFFFSLTLSINITAIGFYKRWFKPKNWFSIKLNPVINFCLSYLILVGTLVFTTGEFLFYGVIVFTIYGFFLTLSLMLSILVEIFLPNRIEDNDERIKKSIERLAVKYKSIALDEQTLLDKLKNEEFVNEPEIISRNKVQDLVTEMDYTSDANEPKIIVYNYDKIVPRWTQEFDNLLKTAKTKCILIDYSLYSENLKSFFLSNTFKKDFEENIYQILNYDTNLSIELLKENNAIIKKYSAVKSVRIWCEVSDGYYSSRTSNTNENFIVLKDAFDETISFDEESEYFSKSEAEFIYHLFANDNAKLVSNDRKEIFIMPSLERIFK